MNLRQGRVVALTIALGLAGCKAGLPFAASKGPRVGAPS
jgi:hypothetical protein